MSYLDDMNAVRRRYEDASRHAQACRLHFETVDFELKEYMLGMPKGTTILQALIKLRDTSAEGACFVERYRKADQDKEAAMMELDRADKEHKALRAILDRTTAEIYEVIHSTRTAGTVRLT